MSDVTHTQNLSNLVHALFSNLAPLLHLKSNRAVVSLDRLRDLVDVLRLGNSLQIVLEDLGEVVCQPSARMTNNLKLSSHSLCNSDPRKYFKISSHCGASDPYRPKFGFSFPDKIFNAVLLPIPFVPTSPSTCPGLGMGNRCNLKLLAPYRWVTCVSRLVGRLMMLMASKGHFFGQMPQPMQRRSEMKAILLVGSTSMQSLPVRTTGHDFLHSCRHFLGLPGRG